MLRVAKPSVSDVHYVQQVPLILEKLSSGACTVAREPLDDVVTKYASYLDAMAERRPTQIEASCAALGMYMKDAANSAERLAFPDAVRSGGDISEFLQHMLTNDEVK